jgi:formylglycine-generating enzyme required for sulfatase activity
MNFSFSSVLFCIAMLSVAVQPVGAQSNQPRLVTNSIGMKLAPIPAGTFIMGSPRSEADRDQRETKHEVTITKPFHMGVYEVKQSEYVQVMTGLPDFQNRSVFKNPNNPVENVEWKMAKIFCERLTAISREKTDGRKYRLPTEAEWEYACRAGSTSAFHAGESLSSDQANFNGRYPAGKAAQGPYLRKPARVGSYKPNAFGLHDMHGNVSEWAADWYDPNYYEDSSEEDPLGPPFGVVATKFNNFGKQNFFVVVRGGNWVDDGRACRSAYRFRAMPNTQYRIIGFRVVCEIESK